MGRAVVLRSNSADALLAGRWFGMLVCYCGTVTGYSRPYWRSGPARGDGSQLRPVGPDRVRPARDLGNSPANWPHRFGTAGEQFRTMDVLPPNGPGSRPDAPTTSAPLPPPPPTLMPSGLVPRPLSGSVDGWRIPMA
jgi:hypothetical protein